MVIDIVLQIAMDKWQWEGHITHRTDNDGNDSCHIIQEVISST